MLEEALQAWEEELIDTDQLKRIAYLFLPPTLIAPVFEEIDNYELCAV